MEPRFALDSTSWRRARDLLVDALERPAGERAAFLDAACTGEEALRAEVESLLAAHLQAATFLENLDTAAATVLVDSVDAGNTLPRELAQYRIERLLGRGGMGVVYLARDTRLDRTVALKFLPHYLSADPAAREQLLVEARAAAALDHTNIAVVHEIAETDAGQAFIVMPYYEGSTLGDWLAARDRTSAECLNVARQIADGLSAAHRRGIVHSDIKPSNILLTSDGVVKSSTSALPVLPLADKPNAPTRGTIAYMSPEQTRAAAVGPPSDIWSLGVLLYELIAGQRPFTADNDAQLIHVIREAAPAPLAALRPDVTPQLAQLVHECLQREAAARPTADILAARLHALEAAPASGGRKRLAWMAAVAVLIVLLSGLFARGRGMFGEHTLDEATIAVLPFAGSVADTALHRLGRDLVITLSTTLQGGSDLRVVDATSVLAQPGAEAPLTAAAADDLARSFGAGRFLHGTLLRTSAGVRADAVLFQTVKGDVIARASATNASGDLSALTDSLTLSLLTQVWGRDVASIPNLAAVTTHSVPALRAYVEGEQAMARAEWAAAIAAFERAFAADSTFWFAYWRSLYPRVYESASPADQERVQRVFANRSTFPLADRLLLESRAAGGPGERAVLLKRVTAQFPHYWPGWYDYANYFVHYGPFLGSTYDDAQAVLQRVVELNPAFEPGWEHLFWIAAQQRDTALAKRALGRSIAVRCVYHTERCTSSSRRAA
jgi:TolB-like protein/predicted Ser/Thr protein kinase